MKKQVLILLTMMLIVFSDHCKAQNISDLVDGYFAYNRFWGNVLVVQNDKVIFSKSYGFADVNRNIKNEAGTLFSLASATKTLTAAAIFKLHDEGKLSVYDRVDKYVPGFINDNTDSLTILNLLNHTSGMAANIAQTDDFSKEHAPGPHKEVATLEQLVDSYRSTKLKNKPGTKYEYNNYGYILLAYIIEKVSGMDYTGYLEKSIFSEAGMTSTALQKILSREPAVGHFGVGTDNIFPVKYETYPQWLVGAAGLYSSTSDLYKFLKAVFSCRLFSGETLCRMVDTCVATHRGKMLWTAGWQKDEIDGHDCYSHGGSIVGYSTRISYVPDEDISVIVLSNLVRDVTNGGMSSSKYSYVDEISNAIIRILNGNKVASLPVPKGDAKKNAAGNYQLDDQHSVNVAFQARSLLLSVDPDSDFTLFDYNLVKEINDTSHNYMVCKKLTSSILDNNFDGFEKYAQDALQKSFFNEELFTSIMNFWERVVSNTGKYLSSNICEKVNKSYGADYTLAYHFEKADMIMQLSFDEQGVINGFYILKVFPKCTVKTVNLIPVNKDEYFVNGIKYGGYKDFNVKYDRKNRTLTFKNDDESFTALKTDN